MLSSLSNGSKPGWANGKPLFMGLCILDPNQPSYYIIDLIGCQSMQLGVMQTLATNWIQSAARVLGKLLCTTTPLSIFSLCRTHPTSSKQFCVPVFESCLRFG